MTCPRTVEAGAYVLGSLPPAQRLDYHEHLAGCAHCRDQIAEFAALPGLLGRLDLGGATDLGATEFAATDHAAGNHAAGNHAAIDLGAADLDAQSIPPRSLLPGVLARLREQRRRQRARQVLAAAVVLVLALAGVGTARWRSAGGKPTSSPSVAVTLTPMRPVAGAGPVQAGIALVPEGGGTRVAMHCVYEAAGYPSESPWRLSLLVYPKGGGAPGAAVASWTAAPGTDFVVTGRTPLPVDQIDRVVLSLGDGTPLLIYPVT